MSDLSRVHVHVGGVVAGHVEPQGVVPRGAAGLRGLPQPSPPVGEPDLGWRLEAGGWRQVAGGRWQVAGDR